MDHNLPSLLLSSSHKLNLTLEEKSSFNRRVWSFDIRLDWTFYSCKWNCSISSKWLEKPCNLWKSHVISLQHHPRCREEHFSKNVCGERKIPIYTPLSSGTRATQTNSQNPPEDLFNILQPKVSSIQLIWLEGTKKHQGFTDVEGVPQLWPHLGKKVGLVPLVGCSEAHEISASFVTST